MHALYVDSGTREKDSSKLEKLPPQKDTVVHTALRRILHNAHSSSQWLILHFQINVKLIISSLSQICYLSFFQDSRPVFRKASKGLRTNGHLRCNPPSCHVGSSAIAGRHHTCHICDIHWIGLLQKDDAHFHLSGTQSGAPIHEARRIEQTGFHPYCKFYKHDWCLAVRVAPAGGRSQVHHDGNEAANLVNVSCFWWEQHEGGHVDHIGNKYHTEYQESYVKGEGKIHVQGYKGGTHNNVLKLPGREVLMRPVSLFYLLVGLIVEN